MEVLRLWTRAPRTTISCVSMSSCRREGRGTETDNILYECAAGKRRGAEWEAPFTYEDRGLILRRLKEV